MKATQPTSIGAHSNRAQTDDLQSAQRHKGASEKQFYALVSVIMPCYNDGAYIGEAVASLKQQTYPNIELIIIDDGSDDPATLEALAGLDFPQMKLLHTNHLRPAGARNAGIREAEGVYILPLDSDDTIEPTYIEKAVQVMRKDPKVGIVYCHADLFGEQTGKWELPDYSLEYELLDNCIFVTSLFKKSDWIKAGGFCETFKTGMEDYDFWLALLGNGCEVVQLEETLFHYRIKPRSRTTSFNSDYAAVQETYRELYMRHRDFYAAHMDEYCIALRYQLVDHIIQLRNLRQSMEQAAPHSAVSGDLFDDPVIRYWHSVRVLKPRAARFVERCLAFKDRLKRKLGRR